MIESSPFLTAMIGAFVGGGFTFCGLVYSEHRVEKRRVEEKQDRVRASARAIRSDFFAFQDLLVKSHSGAAWADPYSAEAADRIATREDYLLIAAEFGSSQKGTEEWIAVGKARRYLNSGTTSWSLGKWDPVEIKRTFLLLEKGRQSVGELKKDHWVYKNHEDAAVFYGPC